MRGLAILLVLMLALLAWLQYRLWFGSGGNQEVADLQARVEQQARQNDGLRVVDRVGHREQAERSHRPDLGHVVHPRIVRHRWPIASVQVARPRTMRLQRVAVSAIVRR